MNKLFNYLLTTETKPCLRTTRYSILTLLVISMACIFSAPLLMPESYSWIANAISESGAQGIEHAWLARFGLLSFGLAIVWLSLSLRTTWARGAILFHLCFGICMLAAAAFSIRPWDTGGDTGLQYDQIEDLLHNIAATVMGFGYTFGVIIVLIQRKKHQWTAKLFDIVAISVATFIPLAMLACPDIDGLIQRLMFFVSYVWYAKEAFRIYSI